MVINGQIKNINFHSAENQSDNALAKTFSVPKQTDDSQYLSDLSER